MLKRNDVISAYRSTLGRDPESDEVVEHHARTHKDFASLVASLRESTEFENKRAPYPGRRITLTEFDQAFAEAERAGTVSNDALLEAVNSFWVDLPISTADPTSAEYRGHQMELYELIARKTYKQDNERHDFDLEQLITRPYPYNTGSAEVVGLQLIGIGNMIRSAALPAGSRVVELGIGWGNTAVQMARMGCSVVGLDIEPKYAAIVSAQAERQGLDITMRQGSFYDIEDWSDTFDAVLFFEAFHHAVDHIRLLDAIPRILKPGGKLILAGEPVNEALPYPWGINCGGIAMYSIRKHGWFELCFRESYLLDVLRRKGWQVEKHLCPQTAIGITYVAARTVQAS